MADAALDALKGVDKFKGKPVPVKNLMVLYPNRMHVVTIEGTGVTKMADLKGKRVSTGSPGSATEVMAFRVIEAAGLDKDKDMTRERLGVAESVNALKDGKIDAFFWVGGLPTAAVTDLANTPGMKIRMIDHADLVAKMNQKYGNLYVEDTIPKSTYKGMDVDNKQATVMNILVAHESMRREDGLQHREDHLRQARRPDRRAQGGGQLQAREPEVDGHADSLPPRRGKVLRRARQSSSTEDPRGRSHRARVGVHKDPGMNEVHVSDEALRKAEAYIEEEEGAANRLAAPSASSSRSVRW
jgi:hypothetical protein